MPVDRRKFLRATALLPIAARELIAAPRRYLLQMNGYPINAETPLELLTDYLTPNDLFFVRSHWIPHPPDAKQWKLTIDGEVDHPLTLLLADLRKMPCAEATCVLQCAGNGRGFQQPVVPGVQWRYGAAGNAKWTGVRVRDVLASHRAGMGGRSLDEVARTPRAAAGFDQRLLHGDGVSLAEHARRARHRVQTGGDASSYSAGGEVEHHNVTRSARVGHEQTIRGFAFSGAPDIAKVEVSDDGGATWSDAQLDARHDPYAWRLWSYRWTPHAKGKTTLTARATDSRGAVQPQQTIWNQSGYLYNGWHSVDVEVTS